VPLTASRYFQHQLYSYILPVKVVPGQHVWCDTLLFYYHEPQLSGNAMQAILSLFLWYAFSLPLTNDNNYSENICSRKKVTAYSDPCGFIVTVEYLCQLGGFFKNFLYFFMTQRSY